MDVLRRVWCTAHASFDTLDRTAVEGHPLEQRHASLVVGDVSRPPQSVAGFFRGRSERRRAGHIVRAQAAIFPRGGERRLDRYGRDVDGTAGAVWRRRFYPPGPGAAAEFYRSISGARKLADRPRALRA